MRNVKANISISVSPEKAINAFTEFDLLQGWWGVERCLVEKQPGGVYALTWGVTEKGFHYVSCGVIKDYQPGKLLEVSNFCYFNPERQILGGMSLKVQVSPLRTGTLMEITQDGYQTGGDWDWYYDAVKTVWPQALQQLKSFLER